MTDETKLGAWLAKMRQANKGKGNKTWHPSCEELAKELGCPDLFESPPTPEEHDLRMTEEVVDFYKKHGRYPSARKRK